MKKFNEVLLDINFPKSLLEMAQLKGMYGFQPLEVQIEDWLQSGSKQTDLFREVRGRELINPKDGKLLTNGRGIEIEILSCFTLCYREGGRKMYLHHRRDWLDMPELNNQHPAHWVYFRMPFNWSGKGDNNVWISEEELSRIKQNLKNALLTLGAELVFFEIWDMPLRVSPVRRIGLPETLVGTEKEVAKNLRDKYSGKVRGVEEAKPLPRRFMCEVTSSLSAAGDVVFKGYICMPEELKHTVIAKFNDCKIDFEGHYQQSFQGICYTKKREDSSSEINIFMGEYNINKLKELAQNARSLVRTSMPGEQIQSDKFYLQIKLSELMLDNGPTKAQIVSEYRIISSVDFNKNIDTKLMN